MPTAPLRLAGWLAEGEDLLASPKVVNGLVSKAFGSFISPLSAHTTLAGLEFSSCMQFSQKLEKLEMLLGPFNSVRGFACVCESYIGKPIGTRAVPQFTTGVAKPLTQIEPGKTH